MKSAVATYAFINAKLRARISALIPRETMIEMAGARSLEEAIHGLRETHYEAAATVYESSGDLLLTELEIARIHHASVSDVYRYVAQFGQANVADFVAAVLLRYEVATIKNAIRVWFERIKRGRSIENKLPYLIRAVPSGIDVELIETIVNASDQTAIVDALADRPYGATVAGNVDSIDRDNSLFSLEIAIDRWYYAHLSTRASELALRDRSVADRLIGIEVDIININWVVRIKAMLNDDSRSKSTPQMKLLPGGTLADESVLNEALVSARPAERLARHLGERMGSDLTGANEEVDGRRSGNAHMLALLESLLNQLLQYESRRALGGYPFTIGVVLAYVALAQHEASGLVTVINGKYYDLSVERIGALI